MAVPPTSPGAALHAYATVARGGGGGPADAPGDGALAGFGATLSRALGDVIQTGHDAEARSMQAIEGKGNVTDVVTAVSKAELALQTTVAIRDRVVQAYQDIMRMPM